MKSREDTGVFFTLWLQNLFRATAACNFSTSQLPKVVRAWCVLCILTWKCVSRHSSVQILISPRTRLRTRRFSEPTFRPSRPTNDRKNTMLCDCIICFLLTLSLPSLLLCSSLLFISLYCRKFDFYSSFDRLVCTYSHERFGKYYVYLVRCSSSRRDGTSALMASASLISC